MSVGAGLKSLLHRDREVDRKEVGARMNTSMARLARLRDIPEGGVLSSSSSQIITVENKLEVR